MNYESIKNEFVKLKKEELSYIDNIAIISRKQKLSEYEKLEIYRNMKNYESSLNEILRRLRKEVFKNKKNIPDILENNIIEIDIDKDFLSAFIINNQYDLDYKKYLFEIYLGINFDTYKYILTLKDLSYCSIGYNGYQSINPDLLQNEQKLIEKPIYIFCGYYDSSEECYGPLLGNLDDYIYGIYVDIRDKYNSRQQKILKSKIADFEKDKTIIYSKKYVHSTEIKNIFNEELLNVNNKSIPDCIISTNKRIDELNYIRSPEYKEKVLLDKINKLYQTVKGEYIQEEILYNGKFLDIISETYRLPNDKLVKKEKVIKNKGKNSVIIIPLTQDKEYIITFQNRIKDKIIAEFPSGYIEDNENQLDAAKRELLEETGYISNDLFIVDEVYTSPGIDNSITYIVIANNCIKTNDIKNTGTELVNYGLFSEKELNYLIYNNIMNGAINKLAYYNLVNNQDNKKKIKEYLI